VALIGSLTRLHDLPVTVGILADLALIAALRPPRILLLVPLLVLRLILALVILALVVLALVILRSIPILVH
jgi:hypothetical protein